MASANLRELDQKLAGELHRRKVASEMSSIKTKMAIESSAEIKHMKAMIQQAYLNKDRAAQISEKQTRSIIHQQEDAMMDKVTPFFELSRRLPNFCNFRAIFGGFGICSKILKRLQSNPDVSERLRRSRRI